MNICFINKNIDHNGNSSHYEDTKREFFKKILVQSGVFHVQEAGFLVMQEMKMY